MIVTATPCSHHLYDQEFEVIGILQAMNDGMIGRLRPELHLPEASSGIACRHINDLREKGWLHKVRAGGCHQEASGLHQFHAP